MPFGELTEYSDTQLKFKLDSNVNAICEIYNISTQNCTYIPDYYFEQSLIQLGYDNIMDNFVLTSNIDHIESLVVNSYNIYNLTGIEDFTALTSLHCIDNQLTSLDVSNNTNLTELACSYNQLTSLDLRNGNNTNMYAFYSNNNPYLTCISVDDAAWSTTNWWNIDAQSYFSEDCN